LEERIERLRLRAFSSEERRTGQSRFPFKPFKHAADFNGVLGDPVLEDMLADRWLRVENTVTSANMLKDTTDKITRLIETELGYPGSI